MRPTLSFERESSDDLRSLFDGTNAESKSAMIMNTRYGPMEFQNGLAVYNPSRQSVPDEAVMKTPVAQQEPSDTLKALRSLAGLEPKRAASKRAESALDVTAFFFQVLDVILDEVKQELNCSVMAAGGCVRDTLLGRPVKDIDLFINVKEEEFDSIHIERIVQKFGGTLESRDLAKIAKAIYKGSFDVWTIENTKYGLPIQLVMIDPSLVETDSLAAHVDTFGIGLSKASYGVDGLKLHRDFITDVRQKTLTVTDNTLDASRLEEYVERIHAKYPEFTVKKQKKQHVAVTLTLDDLSYNVKRERPVAVRLAEIEASNRARMESKLESAQMAEASPERRVFHIDSTDSNKSSVNYILAKLRARMP